MVLLFVDHKTFFCIVQLDLSFNDEKRLMIWLKMFCFTNQPFYISPKQKRKCLWYTMSKYWRYILLITIIVFLKFNRKNFHQQWSSFLVHGLVEVHGCGCYGKATCCCRCWFPPFGWIIGWRWVAEIDKHLKSTWNELEEWIGHLVFQCFLNSILGRCFWCIHVD